ncbi:MAG: CBS domain-containing protein [Pseudomonadota bacterium]
MTMVSEIMTRGVKALSPSDSVVMAARAMEELNVGVVPVCDGQKLVGMVTDRDITIRGVAHGLGGEGTRLEQIMSPQVQWCFEDESVDEVLNNMADGQIRRMPVVDREKRLVGMVTLGDVAAKAGHHDVGESLSEISEPAAPDRSRRQASGGSTSRSG